MTGTYNLLTSLFLACLVVCVCECYRIWKLMEAWSLMAVNIFNVAEPSEGTEYEVFVIKCIAN